MSRLSPTDAVERAKRKLSSIQHLIYKLDAIRVLWFTAHNSSSDGQKLYAEFYHAVGDLLEGRQVEELELKNIDRADFLRELKHDGSKQSG